MDLGRVTLPALLSRTTLARATGLVALPALLTLVISCGGDGGTTQPQQPDVQSISVTPAVDTLRALDATLQLQAEAMDVAGDPVSGVTFEWSSSDPRVLDVSSGGLVTAIGNGGAEITATASSSSASGSATLSVIQRVDGVAVTPGAATLTTVGATQQFTAEATDGNGNVIQDAVLLWQSSDQAVATVDTAGIATARGSGAATITASARGVPANAVLTVNQEVAGVAFRVEPSGITAGAAMNPAVQVEVVDGAGSVVKDAEMAVSLTLSGGSAEGDLLGTTTVNAVSGVASFSGLTVEKAATGYELVATITGVGGATSNAFAVTPASPVALAILSSPTDPTTAGEVLGVQVAFQDEFANTATSATTDVTLGLAENPSGGSLVGTTTVTPVDGVATFDAVSIERAGAGYELSAAASGYQTEVGAPFTIDPAAPDHLAGIESPTAISGRVEEPLEQSTTEGPTSVQFVVHDAFHNRPPVSGVDVSLSLGTGGFPGASLTGSLTATTTDGVATFDNAILDKPGDYPIVASATGLSDTTATATGILFPTAWIGAGGLHTCVARFTGPFCWGSNASGELGGPTASASGDSVAVAAEADLQFRLVDAGTDHSCGVADADGTMYCWGSNASGQLGDGNLGTDRSQPTPVSGAVEFSRTGVGAGESHTCALDINGHLHCWGTNDQGQLGTGSTGAGSDVPILVTDTLDFLTVSSGASHSCGVLTDSTAVCWGDNAAGQLGDGNLGVDSPSPVPIQPTDRILYLDAGSRHTCGIAADGDVLCWGANDRGQLGDGNLGTDSAVPVTAIGGVPVDPFAFQRLGTGSEHACAITSSTLTGVGIACWGANDYGQLGDGSSGGTSGTPVFVVTPPDLSASFDGSWDWFAITAGSGHTCALSNARTSEDFLIPGVSGLWCWGRNGNGQLGNGTTANASAPSRTVQGF